MKYKAKYLVVGSDFLCVANNILFIVHFVYLMFFFLICMSSPCSWKGGTVTVSADRKRTST